MHAKLMVAVAVLVLGCGVGLAAKPPQESPQHLLRKASERLLDLRHAGPIALRYVLRFPDGRIGTLLWLQRDGENFRTEFQVGSLAVSRGVLAGKSWQSTGDDGIEVWWLVSTLLDAKGKLEQEEVDTLKVQNRWAGGKDFLEIWTERSKGGKWVVFLSSPHLDLSLSENGFVRCTYVNWKELPGAGMIPGGCRIYVQRELALEMALENGTNKPIDDAELAPPPDALVRAHCADGEEPKRIRYTPPAYPEEARLDRAQGPVILSATIEADGSVTNVRLVRGPKAGRMSRALVDAAIAAVSKWRYEPSLCEGVPTPKESLITMNFTLQ